MNEIPCIIPDTNYFLEYPRIHKENWVLRPIKLIVSETVMAELRGLANDRGPAGRRAREALQVLNELRDKFELGIKSYQRGKVFITFVERVYAEPPLERDKPDHQLIALARQCKSGNTPRCCILLTNDEELFALAYMNGIPAVMPQDRKEYKKFHGLLKRTYQAWNQTQPLLIPTPEKDARIAPPSDQKTIVLERIVHEFYSRVVANDKRAMLSIAPLEARLEFVVHFIHLARDPTTRIIFVVVSSETEAAYWAAELRQRGQFRPTEVRQYQPGDLSRLTKLRALVCPHSELERSIPEYVAHLKQAGQRPAAIVDGCDLIDPVDLVMLLYECDQFIGISRYALDGRPDPGRRLLQIALRDRSVLNYSFNDAVEEGWGHPYTPVPHPIDFTLEERRCWDNLQNEYLQKWGNIKRKYPAIAKADDFPDAVVKIISKTADPELGEFLIINENLEIFAQKRVFGKRSAVEELLIEVFPKRHRRLIFDISGWCIPDLLDLALKWGVKMAELPEETEAQIKVWDQFAGNKYDTLLLSQVPEYTLQDAYFHQLIILTPLRPIVEVSDMVDWALSHTQSAEALRIDTLFVRNTPEETAMREMAEAIFGRRDLVKD